MPFITDAARLEPGSILRVQNPVSSSGKPTYPHFFIVLQLPDHVKPGDRIPLVGVTSRINPNDADPTLHVAMKWLNRKGGDPETGFDKPTHACVDFTHLLNVYKGDIYPAEVAAEYSRKFIRAEKLQLAIATLNAFTRKRQLGK